MNLSEMSRPLNISQDKEGDFYLTVRPGYLLASLRRDLRSRRFDWLDPAKVNSAAFSAFKEAPEQFWPPDPSELTASIGGIASTNGRGPGAFTYGPAGGFIASLQVVTADGAARTIDKKHELWQVCIGGEGVFGAITALTLRLLPKPLAREIAITAIELARRVKAPAYGLLIQESEAQVTEALAGLPFDQVLIYRAAPGAGYTANACAAALIEAVELLRPAVVLLGASDQGKDMAPLAAM